MGGTISILALLAAGQPIVHILLHCYPKGTPANGKTQHSIHSN